MSNFFRKLQIKWISLKVKKKLEFYSDDSALTANGLKFLENVEKATYQSIYSIRSNALIGYDSDSRLQNAIFCARMLGFDARPDGFIYALTSGLTLTSEKNGRDYFDLSENLPELAEYIAMGEPNQSNIHSDKAFHAAVAAIYIKIKQTCKKDRVIVGLTLKKEVVDKFLKFEYSENMSNNELMLAGYYANDKNAVIRRLAGQNSQIIFGSHLKNDIFCNKFFGDFGREKDETLFLVTSDSVLGFNGKGLGFDSLAWKIFKHQIRYNKPIDRKAFELAYSNGVKDALVNNAELFDCVDFGNELQLKVILHTMSLCELYCERYPAQKEVFIKELINMLPHMSQEELDEEVRRLSLCCSILGLALNVLGMCEENNSKSNELLIEEIIKRVPKMSCTELEAKREELSSLWNAENNDSEYYSYGKAIYKKQTDSELMEERINEQINEQKKQQENQEYRQGIQNKKLMLQAQISQLKTQERLILSEYISCREGSREKVVLYNKHSTILSEIHRLERELKSIY